MDKFMKGHWLSSKTKVKESYVTRKDGSKLRLLICSSKSKGASVPVTGLLWIPVAFHMPLYPMLDDRELTASSQHNDAPVWNTQANFLKENFKYAQKHCYVQESFIE